MIMNYDLWNDPAKPANTPVDIEGLTRPHRNPGEWDEMIKKYRLEFEANQNPTNSNHVNRLNVGYNPQHQESNFEIEIKTQFKAAKYGKATLVIAGIALATGLLIGQDRAIDSGQLFDPQTAIHGEHYDYGPVASLHKITEHDTVWGEISEIKGADKLDKRLVIKDLEAEGYMQEDQAYTLAPGDEIWLPDEAQERSGSLIQKIQRTASKIGNLVIAQE